MTEGDYDWRSCVDRLKEYTKALEAAPVPVSEMPDAAGAVRDIERRLAAIRHGWNDEQMAAVRDVEGEFGPPTFPAERTPFGTVQPRVVGTEYRTVMTRVAKRTYNTAAILHGIVTRGIVVGITDALMLAIREGAARVTWQWGRLDTMAKKYGLSLRTINHAIPDDGDIDAPWVGEDWQESVKQEAVTPGGKEQV